MGFASRAACLGVELEADAPAEHADRPSKEWFSSIITTTSAADLRQACRLPFGAR